MCETKNNEILSFLNKIESDNSYKEILKFFQGVPIICIAFAISLPSAIELRKILIELWKEEKIKISGADYNNLINSLLKNDRSFWFTAVRRKFGGHDT